MEYVARDAGPWTFLKLKILEEYLAAFVRATQSIRVADVCFLDIFAGPGLDRNRETKEIVNGSPSIAMNLFPKFRRFVMADMEPRNTRQLIAIAEERKVSHLAHIFTGDCNSLIDQMLRHVPTDGATFCFLDPAGAHLEWKTVERISIHKPNRKIELLILFPYDMALVRFLVRDESSDFMERVGSEERVDAVMPESVNWRTVYRQRNDGVITPAEARRRFAYIYWMGLINLGYKFVLNPKLLTTPSGHPLYFLFFSSDHFVGERIMKHVFEKPRESERKAEGFQMPMELDIPIPIIENPWDFKVGEVWYENVE